MKVAEQGQEATAIFILGQIGGLLTRDGLGAVKPYQLKEIQPSAEPPSLIIEFEQSGLRYKVIVEPDGRRE